jgi:hypothetical protein
LLVAQLGQSQTGFDPTELLRIRFANTREVEFIAVDSLDDLPKEAKVVLWTDEAGSELPGLELSGPAPALRPPPTEIPRSLRQLGPWARAQAQLLSSLLE